MVMSRGQLGERKRRKWWLWWRRESDHQGREEGGEWGSSTRPSPHPGGFRWHARPKARASCLPFPLQMRALVSPHRPAPLRSLSRGIRSESEPRIRSRSIRAFPSLSSSSLTLSKTRSLHPPALPDPQLALCMAEEIRLFVACNSLQLLPLLLLALPRSRRCPVRSSPLYTRLRRPHILISPLQTPRAQARSSPSLLPIYVPFFSHSNAPQVTLSILPQISINSSRIPTAYSTLTLLSQPCLPIQS